MAPLRFETLRGDALHPWLPALAGLRSTVFLDWPYLYDGNAAAEDAYLRAYAESPGAAVVIAFDGEAPVGIATCEPMSDTHLSVRQAFLLAGLDPARFCYFGESVLLRAYRGQGAGLRFFEHREAHARSLGARIATFCAVKRDPADPRRPADYIPLDEFWRRRGYAPYPELVCTMDWKEPGTEGDIPHSLSFWMKSLDGAPLP
jgi:GNAT superfamily N-acetyltransferase